MTKLNLLYIFVATLISFGSANAIVIRHDIEDSNYLELANNYSASVAYTDYCAFTLIRSDWLLTAAHCMAGDQGQALFEVTHLDSKYRVSKVIIHPAFDVNNDELNDVALVQLKDPIPNGTPASLYTDKDEDGQSVVFIGRGTTGNGNVGLQAHDEKERAATNTVLETSLQHLVFQFDPPASATRLEGISGPADSGGPAFIEQEGIRYIAGVSGFQDRNGYEQAHYNVMEYYSRVSTHSEWIQSTIENTPPSPPTVHPLISAIKMNDSQGFTQALTEVNNNPTNEDVFQEIFYQAVHLDRVEMTRQLIDANYPFLAFEINKQSLLEFALVRDRAELFDLLLERTSGTPYIHSNSSKVFPLMVRRFRRETGVEERARILFSQGANINAHLENGDTALISVGWATNNLPFIQWLVENGADVNLANNGGDTPLMDSARLGKIDIFRYLLSQNADPSLINRGGVTALDIAKARGRDEMVRILENP